MKHGIHWFPSEVLGTFLLVFFGCGSVATAVALGAPMGLFQVAIVWGLGLALAITLTGPYSGAHLNPAITVAFAVWTDFPKSRIAGYMGAQFLGAFLAAALLFVLFGSAIETFEEEQGILRGAPGSEASGMIFGEYYPNPGGSPWEGQDREKAGMLEAFLAEFIGTGLLALGIFGLTAEGNPFRAGRATPIAIGLLLTSLICLFAPISMAGYNPARDFAPRVFSAMVGWGSYAFTANGFGWLVVYMIAPVLGAIGGGWLGARLFSRTEEFEVNS